MTSPVATKDYTASYPYMVRTRSAGKRMDDLRVLKGTHHGSMTEVDAADATPVFAVTRIEGAKSVMSAWDGSLWAPFQDVGTQNGPVGIDRFRDIVAGKDVCVGGRRAFDPFSSAAYWKEAWEFDGEKATGRHAVSLSESPGRGAVMADGGPANAAKAARMAERLALIGGQVHFRIPGPMWQVSRLDDGTWDRFEGNPHRNSYDVVKMAEWRVPSCRIVVKGRAENSVADPRALPVMMTGEFFAWNREGDADKTAREINQRWFQHGKVQVLDMALAQSLTVPGADLAASAYHMLWPVWNQTAARLHSLSDESIAAWSNLGSVLQRLEDIPFGDLDLALRGFGDMQKVMDEFSELARFGNTTGQQMNGVAKAALRRWNGFETELRADLAEVKDAAPALGMMP